MDTEADFITKLKAGAAAVDHHIETRPGQTGPSNSRYTEFDPLLAFLRERLVEDEELADTFTDTHFRARWLANIQARHAVANGFDDAAEWPSEKLETALVTLKLLAAPYADHQAYDQEWMPDFYTVAMGNADDHERARQMLVDHQRKLTPFAYGVEES